MIADEGTGARGIFPTPLYIAFSTKVATIQKEIRNIMPDVVIAPTPEHWGKTHKLSQPKNKDAYVFKQDIIADYKLDTLAKDIDNHLKIYCEKYGVPYAPDYNRTSWMAVFDENEYGHIHNHYQSSVSGCYYYMTDGDDGSIFFPPCGPTKFMGEYVAINESHIVKPAIGKLLMFPGPLEHGIKTNTTNKRRISISFNIDFKRF